MFNDSSNTALTLAIMQLLRDYTIQVSALWACLIDHDICTLDDIENYVEIAKDASTVKALDEKIAKLTSSYESDPIQQLWTVLSDIAKRDDKENKEE